MDGSTTDVRSHHEGAARQFSGEGTADCFPISASHTTSRLMCFFFIVQVALCRRCHDRTHSSSTLFVPRRSVTRTWYRLVHQRQLCDELRAHFRSVHWRNSAANVSDGAQAWHDCYQNFAVLPRSECAMHASQAVDHFVGGMCSVLTCEVYARLHMTAQIGTPSLLCACPQRWRRQRIMVMSQDVISCLLQCAEGCDAVVVHSHTSQAGLTFCV